jgi:hypothetical protein
MLAHNTRFQQREKFFIYYYLLFSTCHIMTFTVAMIDQRRHVLIITVNPNTAQSQQPLIHEPVTFTAYRHSVLTTHRILVHSTYLMIIIRITKTSTTVRIDPQIDAILSKKPKFRKHCPSQIFDRSIVRPSTRFQLIDLSSKSVVINSDKPNFQMHRPSLIVHDPPSSRRYGSKRLVDTVPECLLPSELVRK